MLFNSYIFIFLFLPLTLFGYYFLNHLKKYTLAQIFLIGMSLWFYAYFNISYIFILAGSILVNYCFHCRLCSKREKPVMIVGITANLCLLCYYKYVDFFIENINAIFGSSFALQNIVLPLGISFFTLQQISFLIDSYHGEAVRYNFVEYALFVSFFPQLIAGPIVTHDEMISQFRNPEQKKLDMDFMAKGVMLFVLGLAKKVILADTLGQAVDWGYQYIGTLDSTNAILVSVCYLFQIYFDFSGYCDMAKGLGYMLHVTIPSNFSSPYKAASIKDFWKSWHMTLGRFFTKYIYIPLGGNRKGKLRRCLNNFCVFFISGFWHGANWTYVVWSIMHGAGYVGEILGENALQKIPLFIRKIGTTCFMVLSLVAFRSANLKEMRRMYGAVFSGTFGAPMAELTGFFNRDEFWLPMQYLKLDQLPFADNYIFILFMALSAYLVFIGKNAEERTEKCRFTPVGAAGIAFLFLYSVVCLSGVSSFLYFNF